MYKTSIEQKWKPVIIGVVVFVVVFVGLTLYQQAAEKERGDVILVGGEAGGEIGGEGAAAGEDQGGGEAYDTENEGDEITNASGADGSGASDGGSGSPNGGPGATSGDGGGQSSIFVDVGGAVNLSGLFVLPAGSRVADAIEAAGGLAEDADVKYINRACLLADGDRLYVPTVSEVRDGTAPPTAGQVTAHGGASAAPGGASSSSSQGASQELSGSALININTAGPEELQKLNGVGPVTAQKIIDYRTKKGGFKSIEDLMNVSGIGAKTFEKLRDYVTV